MQELRFMDETGKLTPVCDMATKDIYDVLRDGCEVIQHDVIGDPVKNVEDRLHLELELRALGISSRRDT